MPWCDFPVIGPVLDHSLVIHLCDLIWETVTNRWIVLAKMDLLISLGVSCELSAAEFTGRLARNSSGEQVGEVRVALFAEAVRCGLAHEGDVLVARRKVGGKSLKEKHVGDVWILADCIRRSVCIPRSLLRNGKRSAEGLAESQRRTRADAMSVGAVNDGLGAYSNVSLPDATHGDGCAEPPLRVHEPAPPALGIDVDTHVFRSTILESINSLRDDVARLQADLRPLTLTRGCEVAAGPSSSRVCTLYVRFGNKLHAATPGKSLLESLLMCQILQYVCVRSQPAPAFKVKIQERFVGDAIANGREEEEVALLICGGAMGRARSV